MIKRVLLPVLVLFIGLAVFFVLKQSKPEKRVIHKPEKVWRVNTVAVKLQTISPEITLYGRVETPKKATLKAALVADVVSVNILEGSKVEVGQLLVTLDDTDVQLLLEQRQADLAEVNALISSEYERFSRDKNLLEQQQALLDLADKAVARAKKLEQTRLASQSSLDDAISAKYRQVLTLKQLNFEIADHPARLAQLNARKKRTQALIKQVEVDIKRTKVMSPFDGRVSLLSVAVGDRVRAGDALLSLYDLNNLEVRAQIPGRYTSQIRRMMLDPQTLVATANIDEQLSSFSLDRLSGEVKLESGGIDGLFSLEKEKDALVLGTFIELNLKLSSQQDVFSLPYNALYGLNHVYQLKEGYLHSVNIERVGEYTTENGEKQLLIRAKALRQGDLIVSTQLPNAITGLRVESVND